MLENPVVAGWALAAVAAAIVVVLAWLTFPRGREPRLGRVVGVFGLGLLSPLALLPELALMPLVSELPAIPQALFMAFGMAAIPEEAVKGLVVWLLVLRARPVRCAQDGAFFGVAAGMGFALSENLLYVAGNPDEADQLAFVRVVSAGPMHAAATAMFAHGLFLARLAPAAHRRGHVIRGVLSAVAMHGGYDACLMLAAAGVAPLVAVGAPVILFIGLAAAGNRLLVARKLDAALLARKRGTGILRAPGTGPLRTPGTGPLNR